jgi:hypothetical protein
MGAEAALRMGAVMAVIAEGPRASGGSAAQGAPAPFRSRAHGSSAGVDEMAGEGTGSSGAVDEMADRGQALSPEEAR